MPCKTVVFLGDSIYLNSLNYRQVCKKGIIYYVFNKIILLVMSPIDKEIGELWFLCWVNFWIKSSTTKGPIPFYCIYMSDNQLLETRNVFFSLLSIYRCLGDLDAEDLIQLEMLFFAEFHFRRFVVFWMPRYPVFRETFHSPYHLYWDSCCWLQKVTTSKMQKTK